MPLPLVLIVEDEFLLRMHAVSLLEAAGFDYTLEAGSASMKQLRCSESRKDIRDLCLRTSTFPEAWMALRLAHAIRHRWPPIELLLTSGHTRVGNEDMPDRGLFLSAKPYDGDELVRTLRLFVD